MVRTELYIDGANGTDGYLSFPFGVNIPVSLNFNLADVRNPEQRKASFSKTINLTGTNEVNKLFENLFEVNVVTQYFNKNLKTPVKYLVDGLENFAGDLQLIKVNIKPDNSIVYECSIIGAGGSLFVDIGEKYIAGNANSSEDLDFSAYDHNYTRANQIASRTTYLGTGTGYVYPFIDRGTNGGSPTIWNVKDFLPIFSVYEYIKKIIEGTGRTFTSTFLNSSFFKHLYCYSNVTKLELNQTQLDNMQWYVGLTADITVPSSRAQAIFTDETTFPFFDNGSQYSLGDVTIASPGYYNITSKIVWKFKIEHSNPDVAFIYLPSAYKSIDIKKSSNGGVSFFNLNTISVFNFSSIPIVSPSPSFPSGLSFYKINVNTFYTEDLSITSGEQYLSAGDRIRITQIIGSLGGVFPQTYYNSIVCTDASNNIINSTSSDLTQTNQLVSGINNSTFYGLVTRKETVEGGIASINTSLPTKIKQKEFLTSILRAFNLFVEVNPNNPNDLLIEPFDEFYNTTNIIDYENRTDLDKEQTINPNLLEGKRYIYTYKADKDYYNDLYLKTHNEVFGTEEINVDNDFIKSDKKTELIFSATPLAANYELGIAIPQIYQKDEQGGVVVKKPIAANIRLLYCAVKTSPNSYTYKQQGEADISTNEYLHAGMEDDALNPTLSLMFGPAKDFYYNYVNAYFTTNTLYNKYHKQYLVNLIDRDAKFVTKYLWLTPKDINEFSFRNRLFIDGSYYIVNKIENYTPLEQTSTKVELIKLLDTEAFVPESILISDSSVDAGSEVYTARLNSSLNVGTNIQNRGTNCLAIGENIVIPESCTNLIVFGSNITADENSTGLLLNYKSYVALISQIAPTAATSGLLIIGETYTITTFVAGDNFTNVANIVSGTINTTGCVFIATGTTPTTWTNASTLTNAGNPTAIVLENTIGNIVWTRNGLGEYFGTLTGAFPSGKVICLSNQIDMPTMTLLLRKNNDIISINTGTPGTTTIADNILDNTSIEIRVYN